MSLHNNILGKVIILVLISLMSILFLKMMVYFTDVLNISVPCIYNEIFGIYCPGCGMTRAMNSLFNLDFYQAVRYNLFAPIILVIFVFFITLFFYRTIFHVQKKLSLKNIQIFLFIFLGVLILYGVLRNLNFFVFLVPTVL